MKVRRPTPIFSHYLSPLTGLDYRRFPLRFGAGSPSAGFAAP
jgi:hypothetical protein